MELGEETTSEGMISNYPKISSLGDVLDSKSEEEGEGEGKGEHEVQEEASNKNLDQNQQSSYIDEGIRRFQEVQFIYDSTNLMGEEEHFISFEDPNTYNKPLKMKCEKMMEEIASIEKKKHRI